MEKCEVTQVSDFYGRWEIVRLGQFMELVASGLKTSGLLNRRESVENDT